MKKKLLLICVAVITFLLALVIMLYPIISSMYNERHQSEIHTNFRDQVAQADNTEKEKAKELAAAYNDAIANNVQLTESFSKDALLWEDVSPTDSAGSLMFSMVRILRTSFKISPRHHPS